MTDFPGTVTTNLERVLQPTAAPSPTVAPDPMSPLSTDPLPPISFAEASSRKEELFANEEWRTKYCQWRCRMPQADGPDQPGAYDDRSTGD